MRQFGGHEQAGGRIPAAGHTGSAADAGGCAEGAGGLVASHRQGIAIRRLAGAGGAIATGGNQAVQRGAVHHQILNGREGLGPP